MHMTIMSHACAYIIYLIDVGGADTGESVQWGVVQWSHCEVHGELYKEKVLCMCMRLQCSMNSGCMCMTAVCILYICECLYACECGVHVCVLYSSIIWTGQMWHKSTL